MQDDLVTGLLPVLGRPLDIGFNVFDVMHHGVHEKQMSNVFAWLLEPEATHGLGERFVRIFIDQINKARGDSEPLPHGVNGGYLVRQEVNTSGPGRGADIADLVVETDTVAIIVENYLYSDGHGHSYEGYFAYGERDGRRGVVVLLCRDADSSLQSGGWKNACVLTYRTLLDRLHSELEADGVYQRDNPDAYSFIDQMYRKFVKRGGRVEDNDVLDFVTAMCTTGHARRYGEQPYDAAADRFAAVLAEQGRERFGEGRELLQRVKHRIRSFGAGTLKIQLNETLGEGFVGRVSAGFAGTYQWTINFEIPDTGDAFGEGRLQIKFGPSAWLANEDDPNWLRTVDHADYSHLFITRAKSKEIRQSAVTLRGVLDGLEASDRTLHDEIVDLLRDDQGATPSLASE